ncbi:MAG: helix-turn-helix domain-containing protein, partial [Acidobacteriota bacterium]
VLKGSMDAKNLPLEKLLTPREVASWLDVSVDWVQDHATVKEPRIPVVRIGKLLRFRREDVETFLAERMVRRPVAFSRDLRLRDVAKR